MSAPHAVLALVLSLVLVEPANALTAVCKNATGRAFGVHGKAFDGKAFDEPDAITNATFTLLWEKGSGHATIVTQSAGGGAPSTERAVLVFDSDDQLTFLVLYESAVWFYSIYPGPKVLLMTSHNNGMSIDAGGAVVKSFRTFCEIGD